jgi:hypothetical protein
MVMVATDLLESGTILKSAVCDRSGRLLLPAGTELTDKHLKIFRTWGISEADIDNGNEEVAVTSVVTYNVDDPVLTAEAQREIAALFIHNDPQHPLIQELMRICVERRISRGA